jgi:gliding motility-associated-like protein
MIQHLPPVLLSIFLLLNFTNELSAQDPVDCVSAIPICSSQQLNYNSNGPGINDFGPGPNNNANGCLSNDEHQSAWFEIFISPSSPPGATLAFTLTPTAGAGEDYDFALYGPNTSCNALGSPIRCSYASASCGFCPETGMGMGAGDFSEGAGGDGFVAELVTQPGQSYILLIDNWASSSQGFFLDWTGTAVLSCACTTTATITGDLEICPNETTTLTANGTDLTGFIWAASGGGSISGPTNTPSITATSPGTYTVTVSDLGGCTGTATVNVTQAPTPNLTNSITPSTCGLSNGSINLIVSGGTPPYTYLWSNGATSEDIGNLLAGRYTVTVTGGNGCTATATIDVPDNSPPLTIQGTALPNTECFLGNGSIVTTVIPAGSYTYLWSNGATTSSLNDLPPGDYQVTVTGSGACTGTATFTVFNQPILPLLSSSITPSTCGQLNGEIDLIVTGGVPPFIYLWSNGVTNEDQIGVFAGSYSVTVTGANGCSETANFNVPDNSVTLAIIPAILPNTSCLPGSYDGSISISVSPPGTYDYIWSNGATSTSLSNLGPGAYSVTVSAGGTCTETATFTVPDSPNLPALTTTFDPATCGLSNGSATVITSGGVPPFTFLWSNGETGQIIFDVPAGSYSVTVTGANGCSSAATATVPNNTIPINITESITPNTSCTAGNGAISLNITPAGLDILWSNGETVADIFDLSPGAYSVTVSGGGSCSSISNFIVPDNSGAPSLSITPTASTCDLPNGAADLSITGGVPPYQIAWTNGAVTEDLSGVLAGTYSVVVTSAAGCISNASVTIPNNNTTFSVTGIATGNSSCSTPNGSVQTTVTPPGTYTYIWSNGETSTFILDVAAGTYSVTVSAGGSCTQVADFQVFEFTSPPTVALAPTAATCGQTNGSINATATGGTGPYSFLWSNGATSEDLNSIAPGAYSLTVTDANFCTATASATVDDDVQTPQITGTITAAICGESNGGIDLGVSGAAVPYSFIWSNGSTSEDLANIAPGSYEVTVSSGNGCSATASFNVPNNSSSFSVSGTAQPLNSCIFDNGSIDLNITPSATYDIIWSNGETTEDLDSLAAGTYSVTVTALGTCSATAAFDIDNQSALPAASPSVTAETCGQSNGAIDLAVSGGTAPYTFIWTNSQSTEDLSGLAAGDYAVTVTGANGCSATAAATVPDNSTNISLDASISANTLCGNNNGGIDLNISPSGTYDILWSNGATTEDLNGLAGGSYAVTVSAGGNCTAEASYTVGSTTVDPIISPSITPTVCGQNNGAIDLDISGGVAPFSFVWSNGETSEDLTGQPAGDYSVEVTGANGCASSANFTIGDNSAAISIAGLATENTACANGNGSVDISVTPAGAYSFLWSNGQTSEDLSTLPGGDYAVTVSAGGNCTATATFTVADNPDLPSILENITPSICAAPDGSIDLDIIGGTTPYSFLWSNGEATEDLTGLLSGAYEVTITDANGCSSTGNYNVPNNSNSFTINGLPSANTLCNGGNGGIDLTVLPNGVYSFLWSNGETTEDLSGQLAGSYSVTVSDGSNCSASASFSIADNQAIVAVNGTAQDILCFGENNGSINLTASGGAAPYLFDWSPAIPGNPEDPTGLLPGDYSVVVTDASGCTEAVNFTIVQPAAAVQLVCSATSNVSLPGAADGSGSVDIAGGTAPYSITWSPGASQSNLPTGIFNLNNLAEGPYVVQVTDANGCPSTCSFTITPNDCVTAIGTMGTAQLSLCGDGCQTASYNPLGQYLDPNDVLQYILHEGNGNTIVNEIGRSAEPTFCFDPAAMQYGTTYYISVAAGDADAAGNVILPDACSQVSIGTPLVFYEIPQASIVQPAPLNCLVSQTTLTGGSSLSGSTFSWATVGGEILGNPTQAGIEAGAAGFYTLTVSANGCSNTATVEVVDQSSQIVASITSSPGELLDCTISQITLSASGTGSGNLNFLWLENGAPVSNNSSFIVGVGGMYELVAFDPLTGCADTTSITISDNTDFPPLSINQPQELNCLVTSTTLSGSSDINGVLFTWASINGQDTVLLGSGSSFEATAPGTYYLLGIAPNGCENAEAVTVMGDFALPSASAGPDQTLDCLQTPIELSGSGPAGVAYQWTANSPAIVISNPNSPSITVNANGVYTLTVTDLGNFCTDSDDVEVFQYSNEPQGELSVLPPTCFGDENGAITIETDPANGPYEYALDGQSNGSNNFFAPLAPGSYQLLVTDGQGCTWSEIVFVPAPEQLTVNLGSDLVVELGETATLQVMYNLPPSQLDTILWSPAGLMDCAGMPCDEIAFEPAQQTYVEVTVIDTNGCRSSDDLMVFVKKDRHVYIPNGFSPNGDGSNDVFMIYAGQEAVKVKEFLVFDRWGETVHQYYNFLPNDPAYGWDGTYRQQRLDPAVFVWFAVIEFVDGEEVLFEGDVTLMR